MAKNSVAGPKTLGRTNFFYAGMTGTLGYITGTLIFGFYLLVITGLFGLGLYLAFNAKGCEVVPKGTQMVSETTPDGKTIVRSVKEEGLDCKNFNDIKISRKVEFIFGAILSIVFGMMLLIYIFPYIISGLAQGAARNAFK